MNRLTEKHFAFKCPMNWDEMEVSGSGRHCFKCQKQVFDLTNCSIDEVIALQEKHGPICGSIKMAQVAAVAISLSAAACHNTASNRTTGTPGDQAIDRSDVTLGIICPPDQLQKTK
jgi:hypothetical protein